MIEIRTKLHLEERITEIKSWRIKELFSLKYMMQTSSGLNQDIMVRSGVVILYAHWEGFIKESIFSFFNYLNNIGLQYSELRKNFVTLGVLDEFKDHENFRDYNSLCSIGDFLSHTHLDKKFKLDFKKHISTQSNLNSNVLIDLLKKCGLNDEKYKIHFQYIDGQLLKYRNMIAHGERTHGLQMRRDLKPLNVEWFIELYEKITDIMDSFEADLIEYIDSDKFKNSSTLESVTQK